MRHKQTNDEHPNSQREISRRKMKSQKRKIIKTWKEIKISEMRKENVIWEIRKEERN